MLRRISLALCLLALVSLTAFAQEERISKADQAKPEDEQALIAVLQSADADWQAKHEACRALRMVGTESSIPALAALLNDPQLSHPARYALENMPFPAVNEALRAALENAQGEAKLGILASLGARRDAEAVPLLTPLLGSDDAQLARAAAGALGHIATPPAIEALTAALEGAQESVKMALYDAMLNAAVIQADGGNGTAAEKVCTLLLAENMPPHVRLGAWRGHAYADPAKTAEVVIAALQDEGEFAQIAAQTVAETQGGEATQAYANALNDLPVASQVLLAHALAKRGDSAARGAVLALAGSQNVDARCAAITALGELGTAEDVPRLVTWLAAEEAPLVAVATAALQAIDADAAEEAMVASATEAAPPVRAMLLTVLTDRMSSRTVPAALPYLDAPEPEVREAALNALAQLGDLPEAPAMVNAVLTAQSATERNLALRALGFVAARHQDEVLPTVTEGIQRAEADARAALLSSLERIGTEGALAALVAALDDEDATVADEAVRVLSNWPNAAASPPLLALAQTEGAPRQEAGFQGYVKLARQEPDVTAKAQMLQTAMEMSTTKRHKFQVLSAWSTLPNLAALDAVLPYLEDTEVRNEAGAAVVTIAAGLNKGDETQRARAVEALEAVLAHEPGDGLRARAEKALAEVKQ